MRHEQCAFLNFHRLFTASIYDDRTVRVKIPSTSRNPKLVWLVKTVHISYSAEIDIWPDNQAVSPLGDVQISPNIEQPEPTGRAARRFWFTPPPQGHWDD